MRNSKAIGKETQSKSEIKLIKIVTNPKAIRRQREKFLKNRNFQQNYEKFEGNREKTN